MNSSRRKQLIAMTMSAVLAMAIPGQLSAQATAKHHHYKLIDMGTFGGPASAIDFPSYLGTLNSPGVTVGWSSTSAPTSPTSHPFICGGLDGVVPFITHTFEWNGGVTDLGALPPSNRNCSEPSWVNAQGEVVGISENGELDPLTGFNQGRAVLWKDSQITDLGSFGGYQNAAFSINDRGQIVGGSQNTIPDPLCFFGTTQMRAFLSEKGVMQDLGTLGGNCAQASYINQRGQIVGYSNTTTSPNPATGLPTQDPFLWQNGKMIDLGTLGGLFGSAGAVNNRGQVIGQSGIASDPGACVIPDSGDFNCHPFLWDQGKLIDLHTSTIGGNPLTADGINDDGDIVGGADFSNTGGSGFDAYLWRNGRALDLGHLDGDCFSRAPAISHGQVAGNSFSCDGNFDRAFLWENGSIVDLNTLIPANSPLQLVLAADINDRGEIVGDGVPPRVPRGNFMTEGHGFLLIPCDENHPDIEGCDYSLADGRASATGVSDAATGERQTVAKPALAADVIRRLLRLSGVHSTPWRRGFGAPPLK